MEDSNGETNEFLTIKLIQSGDIIKISLSKINLKKQFNEVFKSLLRELKLKQKYAYLTSEDGKMVSILDLNLSLEEIIKKFGMKLKLYYEKIF
ncbi:MAG: hypothetical protein ACFFDF_01160 [Candidatus Odinarchaeota archaeon]